MPNPHMCELRTRLQGPVEAVISQFFDYFPRARRGLLTWWET